MPEWNHAGDARRAISVDLPLRQSSGLRWNEVYESSPFDSSVIAMLYGIGHRDMAAFAASQHLAHLPGTVWYYSSGTTLILSRILHSLIGSEADYHAFPRRELFERIGMKSALMGPDATGTLVGSSYSYATARDWPPSPDPRAPADLFYASGHDGQVVAIVPSRDLVIVRAGLTPEGRRYDLNGFVAEVAAAFSPVAP